MIVGLLLVIVRTLVIKIAISGKPDATIVQDLKNIQIPFLMILKKCIT